MNLLRNARSRTLAAAAVSAAFIVPLGVFGAPALAKSAASASQYEHSGSSEYQYKRTICHHTHSKKHHSVTITVGASAVKAHLRHHDTLGACPTAPAPSVTKHGDDDSSDAGTSQSGQAGSDHGQSGEQHGNSSGDGEHGHGNGNASGGDHGRGHGK